MLRVLISQSKEEVILSRLQELGLVVCVPCRRSNVVIVMETVAVDDDEELPPEETFARSVIISRRNNCRRVYEKIVHCVNWDSF